MMDIKQAIDNLEYINWRYCTGKFDQAMRMAIGALRAQQDAEKNDPLTLDELREMDGQPVWIKFTGRNVDDRWIIVGSTSWYVLDLCDLSDYGVRWIAYSRPPKED